MLSPCDCSTNPPIAVNNNAFKADQQRTKQAVNRRKRNRSDVNLHSSIADELLAIYLSPQALAETYIGYAGSSATLAASNNYFRVDGPRFWVEFSVQGEKFVTPVRSTQLPTVSRAVWSSRFQAVPLKRKRWSPAPSVFPFNSASR